MFSVDWAVDDRGYDNNARLLLSVWDLTGDVREDWGGDESDSGTLYMLDSEEGLEDL